MALVSCVECGKRISNKAQACPWCGAPAPPPETVPQLKVRKGLGEDEWLVGERVFYSRAAADAFVGSARMSSTAAPPALQKASPGPISWAIAVLTGLFVFVQCSGGGDAPGAGAGTKAKGLQKHEALSMCQFTMQRASRDPERADIPNVDGYEEAAGFYFAWGGQTKHMRMRNGLGLEVAASGSCYVSKSSRTVTQLTIDGKSII